MDKKYDSQEMEEKWKKYWEKEKIYKFDPLSKKPIFSIDVPPPYASAGHLHVGHALHYTQFEIIARYKRMQGFNVHFAPCFDNNGLPTEKYVEEKFNISKDKTTKKEFRSLCLKESKKVEDSYAERFLKTLGHSYDWDLLYTTISPEAQKVSQTSFIDLYEKGHLSRSEEPTLWCPYHQTALAQAEVENIKRTTTLNYINFDLADGGSLTIATTRPELLCACVGIFVHPDDVRYAKYVGKTAKVPIFGNEVKIMEDESVDMAFGTGVVMICTFGDSTDVEWWKKYKLPLKIVVTSNGKLNEHAGKYKGLTFEDARKKIIGALEKDGRVKKKDPLEQNVGTCWRCNTPLEFIVTKQWFIKLLDKKKQLLEQGSKINWYPKHMKVRYDDWVSGLQWDWCISRQRFYGVPIPVWYCKKCDNVLLPDKKELPIDPEINKPPKCKCGSEEFISEDDVFDTWMTSSMSPQISSKWLEKPSQYKTLSPMSLRPQSHDIIRTWAFYTILKSYLHFNDIPWKDIVIGTYILDEKGRGMHKSKGNAIWTHELLSTYHADVVRYWVGTANIGEDLSFNENELVVGKRFLVKLWNASKFVYMHLEDFKESPKKIEVMDKWMLQKLYLTIKKAKTYYESYRIGDAKKEVERFFWNIFCDNYLEIVKDRLYNERRRGEDTKRSAQYVLERTLQSVLKMFAPIMPFVTEEIYSHYYMKKGKVKSIHLSSWPEIEGVVEDKELEHMGDRFIELLSEVRKAKSDAGKSLKEPVKITFVKEDYELLEPCIEDFKASCHAILMSVGDKFSVSF